MGRTGSAGVVGAVREAKLPIHRQRSWAICFGAVVMPIYEYRCRACGHAFSHLHRRLSSPAPPCPACSAEDVKKLFSTFAAASGGKTESCSLGRCPSQQSCAQTGACPLG